MLTSVTPSAHHFNPLSLNDAVEAMKIRANTLNIKLVAEMPLSKQIEAMGVKSRRMEIPGKKVRSTDCLSSVICSDSARGVLQT